MLFFISVSLTFLYRADAYFINIDAHAEECFFDKATAGTKMKLMFEVAEGGFLDIDVKVRNRWAHDHVTFKRTLG